MKLQKIKVLIAIALGSTVLLITVGNGCSKRDSFTSMSSTAGSGNNTTSATTEEVIDPKVKMVSVVYSKQMLDQITSCVGLKSPSDATIRAYQQKGGAVSLYGDAGSVTAPMMMATTSIAAEVCNDLIQQEKNMERANQPTHIFLNWGLSTLSASTALPANRDIADAISRLGLSCWQKAPTNAEMTSMLELTTTGAPTRENAALMVCTAMLSSLKTLLN